MLVRHRPSFRTVAGHLALALGVGLAIVVPWLLYQRAIYGSLNGSVARFNTVMGSLIGPPRTLDSSTGFLYLRDASSGLIDFGVYQEPYSTYTIAVLAAAVLLVGVAALLLIRRGRRVEAITLVGLTLCGPLAFLMAVGLVQVALAGVGTVDGRYLHSAVPLLAAATGTSLAVVFGPRWGPAAAAALLTAILLLEIPTVDSYVEAVYLDGLPVSGLVPVIDQQFADDLRYGNFRVAMSAPCDAPLVGIAYKGAVPAAARVAAPGQVDIVPIAAEDLGKDSVMLYYPTHERGSSELEFYLRLPPDLALPVARDDVEAQVGFVGVPGDPVVRLLCPSDRARAVRFEQTHGILLPQIPLNFVIGWPRAWAAATGVLAATLAVRAGASRRTP